MISVIFQNAQSLFEELENNFEEDDLMDFLINVFGYMEYHVDYHSVAETIAQCKGDLIEAKQQCLEKGMWMDKNFVGREKEIKEIIDVLLNQKYRGISLESTLIFPKFSEWKNYSIWLSLHPSACLCDITCSVL